jgi:hypothetical protein
MQEEHDRRIRWAGFAVEDGDSVCLDAVDRSARMVASLGMGVSFWRVQVMAEYLMRQPE